MKFTSYTIALLICVTSGIFSQGKHVPPEGCYIGAFIVDDPVVQGDMGQFEQLTSKDHSVYFSYTGWGQPFPADWVNYYASGGNAVQIAFEPNGGLSAVEDGEYIRKWARDARESGAPILLRWACEMNGNWVAWHGNPELYKEKFRLIAGIMKEEAPNVAMVWAPNDIPHVPGNPLYDIHGYYPGDEYTDWVGIDFYGVYFYENGTPERKDPREKLRVVYDTYASRKPVMICEWAATHYSTRVNPPQDCTQYAIAQMDSLYRNVQSQFPKVKAICWFSANTLTQNGCNYSLAENQQVLNHYKIISQPAYFRSDVFRNVPLVRILNVPQDTVLRGDGQVSAEIICDAGTDSVKLLMNNREISAVTTEPYNLPLPLAGLEDGFYALRIAAYSSSGHHNFSEVRVVVDKGNNYTSEIIDDIQGAGFSFTGNWIISNSQPDRWGAYYHYSTAGGGESKATWTPAPANAGYYTVSALWSQHSNRAGNAPYIIRHADGEDTVRVNQKERGGTFNVLGNFRSSETIPLSISLTNQADGIVIADAVKTEWAFISGAEGIQGGEMPEKSELHQNYPNPFNPLTVIKYSLPKDGFVSIRIHDILGREIKTAVNGVQEKGEYRIRFDARGLSSGIYFCTMRARDYIKTIKMNLIK